MKSITEYISEAKNTAKVTYRIRAFEMSTVEDSYEEGEIGKQNFLDCDLTDTKFTTFEELVNIIEDETEVKFDLKNAVYFSDQPDRLILNTNVTLDMTEPSDEDIEEFKAGEVNQLTVNCDVYIVKETTNLIEDFKAAGIECYD